MGQSILGIVRTTVLCDRYHCVFRCRTVSLVTPIALAPIRNQLYSFRHLDLPVFIGYVGEQMVFEHGPHSEGSRPASGTGWPLSDCPASGLRGWYFNGSKHLISAWFLMGADTCEYCRHAAHYPHLFGRHHLTKRIAGLC
ncbi:MAG: hypothetical protein QMD80_03355 [archaeon]|nr:hypothetical protein [archaeon]